MSKADSEKFMQWYVQALQNNIPRRMEELAKAVKEKAVMDQRILAGDKLDGHQLQILRALIGVDDKWRESDLMNASGTNRSIRHMVRKALKTTERMESWLPRAQNTLTQSTDPDVQTLAEYAKDMHGLGAQQLPHLVEYGTELAAQADALKGAKEVPQAYIASLHRISQLHQKWAPLVEQDARMMKSFSDWAKAHLHNLQGAAGRFRDTMRAATQVMATSTMALAISAIVSNPVAAQAVQPDNAVAELAKKDPVMFLLGSAIFIAVVGNVALFAWIFSEQPSSS